MSVGHLPVTLLLALIGSIAGWLLSNGGAIERKA
jgi:hypothetical protein